MHKAHYPPDSFWAVAAQPLFAIFKSHSMEYPFGQFSTTVQDLFPHQLFMPTPLAPLLLGQRSWETKMFLALHSAVQQQLKHQYVIKIVYLLQPKHSIIPVT